MLTVKKELNLVDFKAWSGAKSRLNDIIELGIETQATDFILECFGYETIDETALNDFLWFEMDDFIETFK